MENNDTTSFCEQVRAIYGDTQQEFAIRLGVTAGTIVRWENQGLPTQSVGHALLQAAMKGTFPATPPRFDKHIEEMSEKKILELLAGGYGDTMQRFSRRIGVNYATIQNWQRGTYRFSSVARRLLWHVLEHPSDFADMPTEMKRINAA